MIARQAQPPPEEPTSCVLRPTSRNLRGSTNSRRERAPPTAQTMSLRCQTAPVVLSPASNIETTTIPVPASASCLLSWQQHQDTHHSGAGRPLFPSFTVHGDNSIARPRRRPISAATSAQVHPRLCFLTLSTPSPGHRTPAPSPPATDAATKSRCADFVFPFFRC